MDFRPLSGIAIDRDFANIFEELRTPIMDHGQVKELRVVIDKIDIVVAAYKGGFAQDVGQKPMFVLTPRIRNSSSSRSIFCTAWAWVRPYVVAFTSRES